MAPTYFNFAGIAAAAGAILFIAAASRIIYNLFFHPLCQFPGPLSHRATRLAYLVDELRGDLHSKVLKYHDKYGPVVRIAPNELTFIEPDAWKDIYGHRTGSLAGAEEMDKWDLAYRTKGIPPSILAENRSNHALLRKGLSHGFSERSMREQEPIIDSYVSLLITRLREHSVEEVYTDKKVTTTRPKVVDMKTSYNWATFDIIGDLAFGEPFGCLENWKYHPWVEVISHMIRTAVFFKAIKFLGVEGLLMPLFMALFRHGQPHRTLTHDMLDRRMKLKEPRPDFIEGLLKNKDDWGIDLPRLRANAGLLVIAGSETTATLLSGATYYLLSNPDTLKKLTDEVRSSFRSDDDIKLTTVGNLRYMLACLNESLRRYPPVASGLPRLVPKGGANIAGSFVPENTAVSCFQWAMNHSNKNWEDPFSFQPERFLEEGKKAGDRLDAMQPFSVGPRNCIGRNLAYAEMRLIMARILFNFDMKFANPDDKVNWIDQQVFTVWVKPPLNVYLTPVR